MKFTSAFLPLSMFLAATPTAFAAGVGPAISPATVPFVTNVGQEPDGIAFRAAMFAGASAVTRDGVLLHVIADGAGGSTTLTEQFAGGSAVPVGTHEGQTRVSYFRGSDPSRWVADLPSFDRVDLGSVWPGIRAELLARSNSVEKRFVLSPGSVLEGHRVTTCGDGKPTREFLYIEHAVAANHAAVDRELGRLAQDSPGHRTRWNRDLHRRAAIRIDD